MSASQYSEPPKTDTPRSGTPVGAGGMIIAGVVICIVILVMIWPQLFPAGTDDARRRRAASSQAAEESPAYDETQAMMGTVWRVTGTEPLYIMRAPEIPQVPSEIPYHAAAFLSIDDTIRIVESEYNFSGRWWKVRVISGDYAHASGYVANRWLREWCERADD